MLFALPSLVPLPWCPGQLPQSPTPRSTTGHGDCVGTIRNGKRVHVTMWTVADNSVEGVVEQRRGHASTVGGGGTQDRRSDAAGFVVRSSEHATPRPADSALHRLRLVQGLARLAGSTWRRQRVPVCGTAVAQGGGRRQGREADFCRRTVTDLQRYGYLYSRRSG